MAVRPRLVVDASVSLKWHLPENGSVAARALLVGPRDLIAPTTWLEEMANALWSRVRSGGITVDDARAIVESLRDSTAVELRTIHDLIPDAFEIAVRLSHPVHDCIYLALARAEQCEVVTADERLLRTVRGTPYAPLVRPLGTP